MVVLGQALAMSLGTEWSVRLVNTEMVWPAEPEDEEEEEEIACTVEMLSAEIPRLAQRWALIEEFRGNADVLLLVRVGDPVGGRLNQRLEVGVRVAAVADDQLDDVVAVGSGQHGRTAVATDEGAEAGDSSAEFDGLDRDLRAIAKRHDGAVLDRLAELLHMRGSLPVEDHSLFDLVAHVRDVGLSAGIGQAMVSGKHGVVKIRAPARIGSASWA